MHYHASSILSIARRATCLSAGTARCAPLLCLLHPSSPIPDPRRSLSTLISNPSPTSPHTPFSHRHRGSKSRHAYFSSASAASLAARKGDEANAHSMKQIKYTSTPVKGVHGSRKASNAPQTRVEPTPEPAPTVASYTEGSSQGQREDTLTWRDYDPAGGMPLPNGELGLPEINAVFNSEDVDMDTGNYILSVVHWRRMSGALIDVGLDFPNESGVTREMAMRGLQYVRTAIPDVDESAQGQRWAEEESERLQQEVQVRAVKLGLYKSFEDPEASSEPESDQGTEIGRARNSASALQALREAKEAKWEEELLLRNISARQSEQIALHLARGPLDLSAGVQPSPPAHLGVQTVGPSGVSIQTPNPNAWLRPVERKPWVKYYEEHAMIIKGNAIPRLSMLQRLGPSFLLLLLVLAGCFYLSNNYTPPPKSARLWLDTPPSVATLYGVTGVLFLSFILGRLPPLWRTYSMYLTLTPAYPSPLGLIGATLRHDTVAHLASNLLSLWLFGLMLHEDVGRGTFLAIYVAGGAIGGFTTLAYNVFRKQWMTYIFGASNCVLAVAAAYCTLRPNGTVRVFGYDMPIAAWVLLALFGGAEAFAAIRGMRTGIDHAGHLGGVLCGVSAALYLRLKTSREKHSSPISGGETGDAKADMKTPHLKRRNF